MTFPNSPTFDDWRNLRDLESMSVKELLARLTHRTRPQSQQSQFTQQGRIPRKITLDLSVIVAAGATGLVQNTGGVQVLLSAMSHAACRLEVSFDQGATDPQWYPLVPSGRTRPPNGSPFQRFWVRASQETPAVPALSVNAYLLVADTEYGQLEDQGRFAQVSPGGSSQTLLYATTLAGTEVAVIASDQGALAQSAWDGAAYQRLRAVTPAAGLAATAGTLDTFARGAGYNGATWDPLRSGGNDAAFATSTTGIQKVASCMFGLGTQWVPTHVDGINGDNWSLVNSLYCVAQMGALSSTAGNGTWQRLVNTQANATGRELAVGICQGGSEAQIAQPADAVANTVSALRALAYGQIFNGTTWDRARSGVGDVATGVQRIVDAVPRTPTNPTAASVTTTSGQALAANTSNRRTIVKAPSTNTDLVYVGPSGVATTDGLPLSPGESLEWTNSAAMHAVSASGTQALRFLAESW